MMKHIADSLNLIGELIYNNTFTVSDFTGFLNGKVVNINKIEKDFDLKFILESNERSNANDITTQNVPQFKITNQSGKIFLIPEKKTLFVNVNDNLYDHRISISGRINQIQTTNFSTDLKRFQRLIIPIKQSQFGFNDFEILYYTSDIKNRYNELIKLQINDVEFHFYTFKIDDHIYWAVDSTSVLSQSDFKVIAFSIMNVYGFLKGDLFLSESYYITSENAEFTLNLELQYNSIRDSILTGYSMFTTNAYSVFVPFYQAQGVEVNDEEIKKWREKFMLFPASVFSKLVELFLNNDKFSRASLIILEANNQPLELKAASYCVAFEAVSASIKDLFGIDSPSVIDNTTWNNEIKGPFTSLLDSLKSDSKLSIDEHRILTNKLDNWNSPTNRDKLTAPFKQFEYELSKDEYKCVDGRNKFLHGSLPVNERNEDEAFKELYHISLTLHKLVYVLTLKASGFKGFIVNYPKMHSHVTGREVDQDLFIEI